MLEPTVVAMRARAHSCMHASVVFCAQSLGAMSDMLPHYISKLEDGLGEAAIALRAGGSGNLMPVPVCSAGFERITSQGVEMNFDVLLPWIDYLGGRV